MKQAALLSKETTIHKVGGSMMLTLPSVIVEVASGIIGKEIQDEGRKFMATIEINSEGDILVTKIKERKTNVR